MSADPLLGATAEGWGALFRVWAPSAKTIEVVLERAGGPPESHPLKKSADGYFGAAITGAGAGDLYRYRVDGKGPFPDPASRFQPQGVHGPSEIVNPAAFAWTDDGWSGIPQSNLIFYEIHVGAFTPEGTFSGVAGKLGELRDLGVTAIELMPVADFAGDRNWGYDGVAFFAPARCYGTPDDLRRLVNEAHRLGIAVFLDVIYNHAGPDGAYQPQFSSAYLSKSHHTPWGDAFNFDGRMSEPVRDFFIENATRWVTEYHLDGLRLDATHAIMDDSR
ncbi:MAG TPA: alpha-amylase family glycosyl hydrolase, partial [Terriglobia bacterium]|nr:alpha-amylase family glycosyl hydrolase [Terriglobia bacterium]